MGARPSSLGSGPAIVTSVAVKAGDTITEGALLGTVVGRPVLAITSPFPFYRELSGGVTGPDVKVLEAALASAGLLRSSSVDEQFDQATERAVAGFYRRQGFEPAGPTADANAKTSELRAAANSAYQAYRSSDPSSEQADQTARAAQDANRALAAHLATTGFRVLPHEVATVAQLPATVTSVIAVGSDLLNVKQPMAELVAGGPVVRLEVPPGVTSLAVGQAALIVSGETEPIAGNVDSIETPEAAETGDGQGEQTDSVPSRPVAVIVPADQEALKAVPIGGDLRVELVLKASEGTALVVPVTAVRRDAKGAAQVTRLAPDGTTSEVVVEPGFSAQGFVQIVPASGSLKRGDRVLVGR